MKIRDYPALLLEKKDCTGCTACAQICNRRAISMVADEDGFKYPIVDEHLCVLCQMCVKVCPVKQKRKAG